MYNITITGESLEEIATQAKQLAERLLSGNTATIAAPVIAPPVQMVAQTITQTPPTVTAPPVTVPPVAQVQTALPTTTVTPQYTMDQLAVASGRLMDAGKRDKLCAILQSFGAQSLTALDPANYGAFATAIRQEGAQI